MLKYDNNTSRQLTDLLNLEKRQYVTIKLTQDQVYVIRDLIYAHTLEIPNDTPALAFYKRLIQKLNAKR